LNIIQRGVVLKLTNGIVVTALKPAGKYGWNCLCLSDHQFYKGQDILVFYGDLRDGELISWVGDAREVHGVQKALKP
jgi:hypothetical protein